MPLIVPSNIKAETYRPRCFFDISINGEPAGRIIFQLFNDYCPKTCKNFIALCTGECGISEISGKPLHYRNCCFHRSIKNFMIQSGDFTQRNGKGGESIYGPRFDDESFHYKHDKPFLLSMANRGKNTNGSQFFITLAPTPHLDGTHVVFGHVLFGQDVVMKIAEQPVDKSNRPTVDIIISNCGELVPKIVRKEKKNEENLEASESDSDSDSSSTSSSSMTSSHSGSDTDTKKVVDNESKKPEVPAEDQDDNDNPFFKPKHSVKINSEEIPEVPKNKFLARNVDPDNGNGKKFEREQDRTRFFRHKPYFQSARNIKGRGTVRYRTPSPEDDRHRRSDTPPHWRTEQAKLKKLEDVLNGPPKETERRSYRDSNYDDRNQRRRSNWNRYDRRDYRDYRDENRDKNTDYRHSDSRRNSDRKSRPESQISSERRHDTRMDEKFTESKNPEDCGDHRQTSRRSSTSPSDRPPKKSKHRD